MSTTKQAISKELNKLNDYEQQAFYELIRYYTHFHKNKYPQPCDFEESVKPFAIESEKFAESVQESELEVPKVFIPVVAASIGTIAFILQQEAKEASES